MPSAFDIAIIGLGVFVAAGTVYIAIFSITPEKWPDDTPAHIAEGCRAEAKAQWCSAILALAWAASECAETDYGEYEGCMNTEFAERGGNRNDISSDLWPVFWGKDTILWDLVGEIPE